VKGSCEHGNEPFGTTKCWEIVELAERLVTSQDRPSSTQLTELPARTVFRLLKVTELSGSRQLSNMQLLMKDCVRCSG
jgi:hypothetical protein